MDGRDWLEERQCECGCGKPTNLIKKTITERGLIVGERFRFLRGHWAKANRIRISKNKNRNAKTNHGDGYLTIRAERGNGSVLEHRAIAEKILGKPLPQKAILHHFNGVRSGNVPENLVICENRAYHSLLHQRQRAYFATGNANSRKCCFCGEYDLPENLYIPPIRGTVEHRRCGRIYRATRLQERTANG